MHALLLFLAFFNSIHAFEIKDFKIRAREHMEWHHVKNEGSRAKFKGLSNTINIWYERPYDFSFGLALSPLIISGIRANDTSTPYGEKIQLFNIGLEGKLFPKLLLDNIFVRSGIGHTLFRPDLGENLTGVNLYLGIGYEIPFKTFGLALEFAYRRAFLEEGTRVTVVTPSIGFHFYEAF